MSDKLRKKNVLIDMSRFPRPRQESKPQKTTQKKESAFFKLRKEIILRKCNLFFENFLFHERELDFYQQKKLRSAHSAKKFAHTKCKWGKRKKARNIDSC